MSAVTDTTVPPRPLAVGARLASLLAALFWGVLFFGLIDLQVVVFQNEVFYLHYVLEVGWGLLYTVLVMLPLLCWAARAELVALPRCVLAAGGAILLTGLAFRSPGQAVAGVAVAASAAPGVWLSRGSTSSRSIRPEPWLFGLLALGVAGAVAYLVVLVADVRSGRTDEDTWGLAHLPMQAALAVAVPACLAVALLLRPAAGWRLGVILAALATAGLGAVCVAYPTHLGSAGSWGGTAMLAWAVAVAALAAVRPRQPAGPGSRRPPRAG